MTTSAAAFNPIVAGRPEVAALNWSFWLAAVIVVFNLIDGLLTLAVVTSGMAGEANPLMEASLAWGGVPFIVVKLGLVSLGVYLLYLRRDRPLAHMALLGLSCVYAAIVLYHANTLDALVRFTA